MNETQPARSRLMLVTVAALGLAAVAFGASALWRNSGAQPADGPVQGNAAATFVQLDLPDAVANADVIVLGTVVRDLPSERGIRLDAAMREQLRADGRTDSEIDDRVGEFSDWVYTTSVVAAEDVLKGDCATGTIEVRNIGGEVAGYVFKADGFPRLVVGEREIVFLGLAWDGTYEPLAVYSIRGESASTTDQGRDDTIPVSELLGIIRSHGGDSMPMTPAE